MGVVCLDDPQVAILVDSHHSARLTTFAGDDWSAQKCCWLGSKEGCWGLGRTRAPLNHLKPEPWTQHWPNTLSGSEAATAVFDDVSHSEDDVVMHDRPRNARADVSLSSVCHILGLNILLSRMALKYSPLKPNNREKTKLSPKGLPS